MWYFKWRQLWAVLSLMVFFGGSYSGNAGIPEKDPEFELEIAFIEALFEYQMTDWVPLQISQLKERFPDNLYGLNYVDARYVMSEADRQKILESTPPESPYYFDALFYVATQTESVEKKYEVLTKLFNGRVKLPDENRKTIFQAYFSPDKRHPEYQRGVAIAEQRWALNKATYSPEGVDVRIWIKEDIYNYTERQYSFWCGTGLKPATINFEAGFKERRKQLLMKHLFEKPELAP